MTDPAASPKAAAEGMRYAPNAAAEIAKRRKREVRSTLRRLGWEVGRPGGRFNNVSLRRLRLPAEADRRAVLAGSPMWVDLRRVVTPYGFSFADTGWHAHWQVVDAHLCGVDFEGCVNILLAFFSAYRPRTVQEALFGAVEPGLQPLPHLHSWDTPLVWTMNARVARRLVAEAPQRGGRQSVSFGPLREAKARREVDRLVAITKSIERSGYRPLEFNDGVVEGYFLIDHDDHRFVPTEGQHRLAVLRALGYDRVLVSPRYGLAGVPQDRLHRWTLRHGGPYGPGAPQRLFTRFFADRHPFQETATDAFGSG